MQSNTPLLAGVPAPLAGADIRGGRGSQRIEHSNNEGLHNSPLFSSPAPQWPPIPGIEPPGRFVLHCRYMMRRTCTSAAFGCWTCSLCRARRIVRKPLYSFTNIIVNGNKKGRENWLPSLVRTTCKRGLGSAETIPLRLFISQLRYTRLAGRVASSLLSHRGRNGRPPSPRASRRCRMRLRRS